jgi:alpha-L-rhamnosidase
MHMEGRSLHAIGLRCQYLVDPLGVDARRPRLGWASASSRRADAESAYQVLVASEPGLVAEGVGDLWDSGRMASGAVGGVVYGGVEVESRQRCWWTVRLWGRDGESGQWAEPASFELGLLDAADWQAKWIGADPAVSAPLLRVEFELPEAARRARAYVTGLGYYELILNGVRVGDHVLDPASTTYDHHPDLRDENGAPARVNAPRVLYVTHDVRSHLRPGPNAIGLMLGRGWYSIEEPAARKMNRIWGDRPIGLVQLEVELERGDRVHIVSDGGWRAAPGPILANDLAHGERYDARRELPGWDRPSFDDSGWEPATVVEGPVGTLRSQPLEPSRVVESKEPVAVTQVRDGVQIVDFGQHVSGWTEIAVSGPAGAEVKLRHGGRLGPDGELDDAASAEHPLLPARQTDSYVLKGEASETWEPRFTLHGFRYVEVSSVGGEVSLEGARARVVHNDLAATGAFSCSEELLNRIHENVEWTLRASFQGIPQDAADRDERVGWLGDPGWVIEDYFYSYDTPAFWLKWLDDIRDSQLASGNLPVIAPIHWELSPAADEFLEEVDLFDLQNRIPYNRWPDWSSTYHLVVWHLYRFWGDPAILEAHFEGLRRGAEWMSSRADGHIVADGIGDHMEPRPDGVCAPLPERTPVELTSTAWYFACVRIVAQAAEILGKAAEARRFDELADSISEAFDRAFFDHATGGYGPGTQTSLALPLWLGLVPEERHAGVVQLLVEDIRRHDDHLSTGIMGTAALEQVLPEHGAADVMYDLAMQTTFPSWGEQVVAGATSIWEAWGNGAGPDYGPTSQNMKMFISIEKFLYKDVAGITLTAPGWREMRVKPALTDRLASASAKVETARGVAAIEWRRTDQRLAIDLEIPPSSVADVWLPVADSRRCAVEADGVTIWKSGSADAVVDGLGELREEGAWLRLAAAGGRYKLDVRG